MGGLFFLFLTLFFLSIFILLSFLFCLSFSLCFSLSSRLRSSLSLSLSFFPSPQTLYLSLFVSLFLSLFSSPLLSISISFSLPLSPYSLSISLSLSRVPLIRFCQRSSLSSRDSDEAARVPRSGDRPGPPLQPRAPCALGPRSLSAHRTALEPAHERRGRALCLCDVLLSDPLFERARSYPLPLLTKLLLFLRKILTCLSF